MECVFTLAFGRAQALSFPEAFSRLTGSPPPAELLRALPVLQRQQVLLPARDLARKTSGWLDKASAWLLAMAGSVERLEPAAAEPEESGAEEEGEGGPARFPKAMRGWLEERRASLRRFRRRWWPSHPRQRHARRDGDGSQRRGGGREGEGSAETSFRHQQAVAVPVVEATARTEEEES